MRRLTVAFVISALVLLVLAVWQPGWVAAGTLAAALNASSVILGCLLLGLITPLIRGRWQLLLAPGTRLGLSGIWLIVPMLLPVLLGMAWLYPWFHVHDVGFRGVWLSPGFFMLRTLLYGVVFIVLQRWVVEQRRKRCGPGLIIFVLVSSLSAVDWLMSLQQGFASSLFGLLLIARQLLAGLAFCGLCVLCWNPLPLPVQQRTVLRGLLVSALAFWVYVQFMQYLIVWSVNLAHETQWYRVREQGGWGVLTGLLVVAQLLCLLVLASPVGHRERMLIRGCCVILLLGAVESIWMSLPSVLTSMEVGPLLIALLCQVVYGLGLWAWWQRLWQRRRHET
ncbi:hypothetical protein POF45_01630 [Pseudomonas sp. 681]|uniref:Uncharacterized protein n=1 Tax=Pseudomonas fungipugnans TaxID=3024217 RepID=A0ABT6QGX8_9PSED|nr:hypothetical protein [Pseudomonas sp. 681]MDI2590133.1 hypothetical protein [Pseudomonas sp. 681]